MADCDHVFSFFDGLEDGGYTGLDRSLKVKASSWHNFVDCITKSLALDSLLTIVRLVYIPTRASPPESNAIPPGLNRAAIDPGISVGCFHREWSQTVSVERKVRTAKLQTVIDAAIQMLRTPDERRARGPQSLAEAAKLQPASVM
jgi:hypothetical protein